MMLNKEIITLIAEDNLAQLFAPHTFEIHANEYETSETGIPKMIMLMIYTKHDQLIANIEIRGKKIMSTSFYSETIDDEFLDMAHCVKCICESIEEISRFDMSYYHTDSSIVVDFTEIGIDYPCIPEGRRRDLIVKRGSEFSILMFSTQKTKTIPLNVDEVERYIMSCVREGCTIDLSSAKIIPFSEDWKYAEYIKDDIDE